MVAIYGPACRPTVPPKGNADLLFPALEPLRVPAETLAEALAAYTREFGIRFRPYDGSFAWAPVGHRQPAKYFWYESAAGGSSVVDIHIRRGLESICPKQDLSLRLLPDDDVVIGPRVC
jgi:hypothetical protein